MNVTASVITMRNKPKLGFELLFKASIQIQSEGVPHFRNYYLTTACFRTWTCWKELRFLQVVKECNSSLSKARNVEFNSEIDW